MNGEPIRSSRKDIAEFLRLCFRHELLPPAGAVAWADEMIAAGDDSPWALDLARISTIEEADGLLRHVPGESNADHPYQLFLALVYRLWKHGRLSIEQMSEIGWDLHLASVLPQSLGRASWGQVLFCRKYELDEGERTEAEIRTYIDEQLSVYSADVPMLPLWAIDLTS